MVAGGQVRALSPSDRSVCADISERTPFDQLPTIIERLADDPAAPRRFVRTVIGGVTRGDVRSVEVLVRGRARRIPLSSRQAWIVVLPGSVRRSDIVIVFRGRHRTWRMDFRTGRRSGDREFSPIAPGPRGRALTVADPTGGPRVALMQFATRDRRQCVEVGRMIAGEAGVWSPEWGAFLDLPTLVPLPDYAAGDWQPSAPTPQSTTGCTGGAEDGVLAALTARRIGTGLIALGVIARPGTRRIAVRRPDGRYAALAHRGRTYLAAVPSTGALGERVVIEITDRRGRRGARAFVTGDQNVATLVDRVDPVEGGAVLRVQWVGGFEPYAGVDVAPTPTGVDVTVLTRYGPDLSPQGIPGAIAAIGIPRCVDVVLAEPLASGATIDFDHESAGPEDERPDRTPAPDPRPCVRVTPGSRIDIPRSTDPSATEPAQDISIRAPD